MRIRLKQQLGCRDAGAGTGAIASAGLWAMLGAAEALSYPAATGEIAAAQAQDELFETIVAMVARAGRPAPNGAS